MHQHLMDQAVSFLIPLMERESEPVYLFLFPARLYIACLANLHTHTSFLHTSISKVIILSSEYFIVMRSVELVWKWMMITYPHQRTSQHQMKKYRVLQVTGDSIGSVIAGQQGIEISPPNWKIAMGGVH